MISVDIAFIQQLIEQKVNIEKPTSIASASTYIFAKCTYTCAVDMNSSVSKTLTNFFVMYTNGAVVA